MELKELRKLTQEWQKRLRLVDWNITVNFFNHSVVDGYGSCQIHLSDKTASVSIVPEDQIQHQTHCLDTEVTLVHELIHIKAEEFLPQGDDRIAGKAFECFVEHVAQALVAAKRAKIRV